MLTPVMVIALVGFPLPMQVAPPTPGPPIAQPSVPAQPAQVPAQPAQVPPQPAQPQPAQSQPVQPGPVQPGQPSSQGWGQPYYPQPYGYPPVAAQPTPPEVEQPDAAAEQDDVGFFARLNLGFGTPGFSGNTSLLSTEGYSGFKLWTTLDMAYMFHRRIGAGVWFGLNRRASAPDVGPALNESAYFVAAEAPIVLVGSRTFALHVTPRLGYAAGKVEVDTAADGVFQHAFMWGGAIDAITFKYHMCGGIALMRAETGPPGEAGRDHDYGGFYVTLGGTIDG